MNLNGVVDALVYHRHSLVPRAVDVLLNHNKPLSQRDVELLQAYAKERQDQIEAGVTVDAVPEAMETLLRRPLQSISTFAVVQCVVHAARNTNFPRKPMRQLLKRVLPTVCQTAPLPPNAWTAIFALCRNTLHVSSSKASGRCLEIILAIAGRSLFTPAATHASDATGGEIDPHTFALSEKEVGRLPSVEVSAVRTEWLQLLVKMIHTHANAQAVRSKHAPRDTLLSAPHGNAALWESKQMKRLVAILGAEDAEQVRAAIDALPAAGTEKFTLLLAASKQKNATAAASFVISKDLATQTAKPAPTVVVNLLGGDFVQPGTLSTLEAGAAEDTILFCLYNLGLTTTTLPLARGLLATISAMPASDLAAYAASKGAEGTLQQIFNPYINNAKVFTPVVAEELRGEVARLLLSGFTLASIPVSTLLSFGATLVVSKCRSAQEKAAVLVILDAVLSAIPADELAASVDGLNNQPQLMTLFQRELASPAIECATATWRLLKTLKVMTSALEDVIASNMKQISGNSELRAVAVRFLPASAPERLVTPLVESLLEDCIEVEVVRTDAFFALLPAVNAMPLASITKAVPYVCRAEVLAQLRNTNEERLRAVETAIALAKAGVFDAFAMLMTHRSNTIRRALKAYVESIAHDASALTSAWDSIAQCVMGKSKDQSDANSAATPTILSKSASDAVVYVAHTLLLTHTAKLPVSSVLAEVLLCCGHDNVQGADPLFFVTDKATTGRYRGSSCVVQCSPIQRILTDNTNVIVTHTESIVEQLLQTLVKPTRHLSTAAARAISVLLYATRHSDVCTQAIVSRLCTAIGTSAAYFRGLDARDQAIAAESQDAIDRYEHSTLVDQHLIKQYTPKPPKGMSEEDYEDMKRRDAAALLKGKEAIAKDIEQRRVQISNDIIAHKAIFAALRVVGTTGNFAWEALAVLYPPLQDIINDRDAIPEALYDVTIDAIAGLLSTSTMHRLRAVLPATVARLWKNPALSTADVQQLTTLVQLMRQTVTKMLPAPFFVVLLPFATVAFKAGKSGRTTNTIPVAAQHQLLGIVLQNIAQQHLPRPHVALELLCDILKNFPALYKSVQMGVSNLMPMLPLASLDTLANCLFNGTDSVKEVVASAYHRFSHFDKCRKALVVAACFTTDESATVAKALQGVLADNGNTSVQDSDWDDLLAMLGLYGNVRRISAQRIGRTLLELFKQEALHDRQMQWIGDLRKVGGMGAVVALQVLSPALQPSSVTEAMEYLCSVAESTATTENVMQMVLAAGRTILSDCELTQLGRLGPELQTRLQKPPKESTATHKEQYLAITTVWMTIIASRLRETSLLEAIVDQQQKILATSQSMMVHRFVCDAMAEITRNEDVRKSQKLDVFVETCLKQALHSGSYVRKMAHAWGIAGVVKGLGITAIRRFKLLEALEAAAKEKQAERCGVMVIFEVLCSSVSRSFEPYALVLAPILLEGVAEKDSKIVENAGDASKAMMRNLSAVGLRQLIPRLISGLASDKAKQRIPSLNFIGYVAYSSPKQLAATLPEITRHIAACLFDVNSSVSSAAFAALKRVAGVVANPEIQEHVDLILNAMRSPSSDTENALDALLYTRFVNVVDPASLALIIPVLSRGLSPQMTTRAKAAQIVASTVDLVTDPQSLRPYSHDLVVLLEAATLDPQAEVRTTSAKAIAALTAAVGGSLITEVGDWAMHLLERGNTNAVEKAGAAQAFVELAGSCGPVVMDTYATTIANGMLNESAGVREGFLHILIFAPSTLPQEMFQVFLPIAFPWVLEGLSHLNEKVRDVALLAGSSIISLHGTRNLSLITEPLQAGVISEVNTLRQSSMILTSKLLIHLVSSIKRKLRIQTAAAAADDVDGAKDSEAVDLDAIPDGVEDNLTGGGTIQIEAARDAEKRGVSLLGALEEQLGKGAFSSLLTAMHIGRSEHNLAVRTNVTAAWQVCVASPRGAMTKIFDSIVAYLVRFGHSLNPECNHVAEASIEYTCARLHEMVERLINAFAEKYKEGTREAKVGSLFCLSRVIEFADSERIKAMGGQLVGCVLPGMQDEDEQVQAYAGLVFSRVSKAVGSRLIETVIESQIETSVRGVIEVVKVRPQVALAVIFKHLGARKTYRTTEVDLVDALLGLPEAEEFLPKFIENIVRILFKSIDQGVDGAEDVMQTFVEGLEEEYLNIPIDYFTKAMKQPATQLAALRSSIAYGLSVTTDSIESINAMFRVVIGCLGHNEAQLRSLAAGSISQLLNSLDERVIGNLEEEERQDVTTSRRAAGRYSIQFLDVFQTTLSVTARAWITSDEPDLPVLGEGTNPRLFDALMAFYNRGLDYGTPMQKVQAVECIQDLLTFAPHAVGASATNTIAGRCSKVLFVRNDGPVVLALVQLCLQLMTYPASGKEKMVEGTMALAMFNAALCDSGEARVLALRVVITLLQRSEKYADLILGTIVTKKNSADTPVLQAVLCRFLSVVVRYGNFTKALGHITKLLDLIRPMWESASTPATAAAAGSAIGAMCKSASISDELLSEITERALQMTATKGTHAIAGFAFVYSVLVSAPNRINPEFTKKALDNLNMAAGYSASDKMTMTWMLRTAAILATQVPRSFSIDTYLPILRKVDGNDETMLSTSQYLFEVMYGIDADAAETKMADIPREQSHQWATVGHFDADLDDEVIADTVY